MFDRPSQMTAQSGASCAATLKIGLSLAPFLTFTRNAQAAAMNMSVGVTETSQQAFNLHMLSMWRCVFVGIVVIGAMYYSMYAHRRSKNPTLAKFQHSTLVEVVWTLIPVAIRVVIAVPATVALTDIEDNNNSDRRRR